VKWIYELYKYSFIDVACHEIHKHLLVGALNSCRNYFLYIDSYIVAVKGARGNLSRREREREREREIFKAAMLKMITFEFVVKSI
jgi:hypothetical protein